MAGEAAKPATLVGEAAAVVPALSEDPWANRRPGLGRVVSTGALAAQMMLAIARRRNTMGITEDSSAAEESEASTDDFDVDEKPQHASPSPLRPLAPPANCNAGQTSQDAEAESAAEATLEAKEEEQAEKVEAAVAAAGAKAEPRVASDSCSYAAAPTPPPRRQKSSIARLPVRPPFPPPPTRRLAQPPPPPPLADRGAHPRGARHSKIRRQLTRRCKAGQTRRTKSGLCQRRTRRLRLRLQWRRRRRLWRRKRRK